MTLADKVALYPQYNQPTIEFYLPEDNILYKSKLIAIPDNKLTLPKRQILYSFRLKESADDN